VLTIPSPCDSTCRIDAVTGWCQGCKRTLGEIADWPMLSNADKRRLSQELEERARPGSGSRRDAEKES
jgi:predicted Fe-S protein YdhL (DUF1289 family)